MKSYFLYIMFIFSLQSISCASYQVAGRNRIYTENEVDSKPAYPGGDGAMKDFVNKNIKWPNEYGYSGYVIVSAVITKNGNLVNSKVKRTLCSFCDSAALQVLEEMPRWSSGRLNGKRVNTLVDIPIRFEIIE